MNRVQMNVIPLRGAVASGRGSAVPLLVRILPPNVEQVAQRPPLNLALALDRSGSMSNGKMELAQEAACNLASKPVTGMSPRITLKLKTGARDKLPCWTFPLAGPE